MSFTETDQENAVHAAGEFEMFVEGLTRRLIEAEANGESLQNVVHVQAAQIERQDATINRQAQTINDLIRDNKLMHKTLQGIHASARETLAQMNTPPQGAPKPRLADVNTDGADRLRFLQADRAAG